MHFIFAKLYQEYLKFPETAKARITTYITIFYLFLSLFIILPTESYIKHHSNQKQTNLSAFISIGILLVFIGIIVKLINSLYIKNNYIQKLADRYRHKKLNKALLYFIVFVTYPILLLTAGMLTVLINGGMMWGNQIKGWLE